MGMQMGSTMSMGSTGSTETESSLESSCSKDSASTSSSLSTSSCEPTSTVSYGSATGGGSSSVTSKTTETSTAAYATPRKDVARTSPIASTDLSTAITQELQRRAQQVRSTLKIRSIAYLGSSSAISSLNHEDTTQEQNIIRNTILVIRFYRDVHVITRIAIRTSLVFPLVERIRNFLISIVVLQRYRCDESVYL